MRTKARALGVSAALLAKPSASALARAMVGERVGHHLGIGEIAKALPQTVFNADFMRADVHSNLIQFPIDFVTFS